MRCAVYKCKSSNVKGRYCRFYSFPADETIKKKWKAFCSRPKDFNASYARICSLHFVPDDIERSLKYEMGFSKSNKLKPCAVPTVKEDDSWDLCNASFNTKSFQEEYVETIKLDSSKSNSDHQLDSGPIPLEVDCVETIKPKTQNCNIDHQCEIEVKLAVSNDHQYASKPSLREIIKENFECTENEIQIQDLRKQIDLLKKENFILKEREKKSNSEINGLKKLLENKERDRIKLENSLRQIFSEGQVKKLKNGNRRQVWSETDIAESITWYAASPKTYTLLRKKNYPLPGIRTLQNWTQKIDISPGVLESVKKILMASTHLDEAEKVCVLSFDEMKIRKCYSYERSSDTTTAPCNCVQVAMLRGLNATWKHPVFYSFDSQMTKNIIVDILDKIKACGYHVVAIVAKLGSNYKRLFSDLEIGTDKPWFSHNNNNVYVFPDVPHLIKMLRNQFLDRGFIIDGKEVKKDIISKLLSLNPSELSKTHTITSKHLNVSEEDRQKVKLASKLFSNTTSESLTRAAGFGFLNDENWFECSKLLKLTNDWFDVMNVRAAKEDSGEHISAYGLSLDFQNKILNEMSELVLNMRVIGESNLLQFQKGIVQGINALKLLFDDLKSRFGFKYILTYRLNQDILENFFVTMCSTGSGLSDLPNCNQFKNRLRSQILGANVEKGDTPELEGSYGPVLKAINKSSEASLADDDDIITEDGDLEYLAGYIFQKLHKSIPNISVEKEMENPLTWVGLSDGPTNELMDHVRELDTVFIEFNQDKIKITSKYLEQLLELANEVSCDENVKKLFFKARTYSRIRMLNSDLEQHVYQRKRKYNKTID